MLKSLFVLFIFSFATLEGLLDSLTLSGSPAPMTIAVPAAGSQPSSVVNNSTTYSVSTISVTRRITGQVNTSMPTGTTLQVQMQAPLLATSQGNVTMTTTATNLVTGILVLALQSGLQITYTLSATLQAAPVTNSTVVVTYTLL